MSVLDLVLSLVVVAAAAGFLFWQLALRRRAPACHTSGSSTRAAEPRHSNVVLDDKLARALARAKRKRV